jgi:asparagine synthase (glutamine-hydrolysing)
MCGIAGYCDQNSAWRGRLDQALGALRHRGPDDTGTAFFPFRDGEVALGSTRLSIVDLSSAGHMPMSTEDGMCTLVFNGEIYDAPVHRREMERSGVRFKSRTDTEVLLYGLAREGPAFLDRIDGMYAFAFWDQREPAGLLLGRDRFGEKPLFVVETSSTLFFASELPPLLQLAGGAFAVDLSALRHVVEWGYSPPERTVFEGVRKLKPGSWEWHGGRRQRGELQALTSSPVIHGCTNLKTAGEMVRVALEESVRSRLVADVPTGVFLSGGMDSAGIAAIASTYLGTKERLNTYTVGYVKSVESELEPAREIAKRLGTCHRELTLGDDMLAALPYVAAALGEPVGDPASLPTFFLSLFASQTSTVLLTGEGADELFFGYPRYLLHDIADRFHRNDWWSRDRSRKGLAGVNADLFASSVEPLQSPDVPMGGGGSADWSRADDIARWLPSDVLTRVDRMTMAASIESRSPYLAREVARLGFGLSAKLQRRFPFGKIALRHALQPYLPIGKRWGSKRPFAVPLISWLKGPLRHQFDDVFFGERLAERGWFSRSPLRSLGAAVLRGDRTSTRLAWTILMLELWARAHIDGEQPAKPNLETAGERQTTRKNVVLALDFPPVIGGIQSYNQELWGHGGFGEVAVVAPKAAGDTVHDRAFPGKVQRLPAGAGYAGRITYLASLVLHLPRYLARRPIWHVSHTALSPVVWPFSQLRRSPLVVWTYALELTNPRFALPTRLLLRRADRVVVISEYTRALALSRGARPDRVVKISPGGDDLRRRFPKADGERFKSQMGIASDEFVILSVGRLAPLNRYKGFDRVLEVAALMASRSRIFRWVVIGGGPDLEMYRSQVQRQDLESYVHFSGKLDDAALADAYAACDLFCLFSREEIRAGEAFAEGYGIVFVQAGSFGKPVLGLNRGGVADAVLHRETGILLDSDDTQQIAANVEWLLDHPAERSRLGANGERYALGEGSWSRSRARLHEMLETL